MDNPATDIIINRHSTRAFLDRLVPRETLEHILSTASWAPSGTNTQPWRVYVVQGEARQRIIAEVCAAHDELRSNPEAKTKYTEEYDYYPKEWRSPYVDRRRETGWGLYGLLGIGKSDRDKMFFQDQKNFRFFGAPVGLFFTIDRIMGQGSLLDYGMFLQNIMLGARSHGLATCPQGAWNKFHSVILPILCAGPDEMLVCGMALGWADSTDLVNQFRTPRVPVGQFAQWLS
ncbi:MAG: nitroreductase [Spirochaetales bacterium]|nr:nitroreductase [Spirochaetales bacterium]